MPVIQVRLIVGGNKWFPDIGSEIIAGYKDGWSHIETFVPKGLDWAPEGWTYGARMDTISRKKLAALVGPEVVALVTPRLRPFIGVPRGVQLRPPGYTTFRRCGVLTVPVTDQQWTDYWAAAHEILGRPYDWRAVLSFAAPFGWTRNWHEDDSFICSEVEEFLNEKAKILSEFWLAPNKISPGMEAARLEVKPGVWYTEIPVGTDPTKEAAIALEDWGFHVGWVGV